VQLLHVRYRKLERKLGCPSQVLLIMAARNTYLRSVLTLLGGSALAQVLPLALTPLLTRWYPPEAFGALALLLAVVNPLSLFASGRYELTVPLPKEDGPAQALVRVGLVIALITSVLMGMITQVASGPLVHWAKDERVGEVLVFVPLLLLGMALFQPLNHWLIRRSAFRSMSVNKVVQMAVITLASLVFGGLGVAQGLMIGYVMGWGVNVVMVFIQARSHGFQLRPVDLAGMQREATRYRNFPMYNAFPAVVHTAALSIPVFLLSAIAGTETTGQFNLSRQVVFMPSTFIAVAFAQVYMQRAAQAVVSGTRVMPELKATLRILSVVAATLAAVLIIAGPGLFAWAFGAHWEEAGHYARILAIPIAVQFVVIPLTVVMPALGRIRTYSLWQVGYFLLVLGLCAVPFRSVEYYLWALAGVETACYTLLLFIILRATSAHDSLTTTAHDRAH
jgi:O-antigen/teichoic acid export membrane protein